MQLFPVLVCLLSSHHAAVTAWAGCTGDRDKDHRPRENCTALGFSDVPSGFEPTTKVMLLPNNLFSSLSWSSFQIFTEIHEIDLSGNKVSQLTPSVAPILPTLSILWLGSNRLTSLADGSFSACPALTELYLDNNAMASLSDHTFSGLSKLEILDLSSNHIKVLPELMLHPLLAIETLYLENNKINVMPDNWFKKKEAVPYLYLSVNPWTCSCSLGYLRRYLDDYEYNVYVRDGPNIISDGESVVCSSPQEYKDKPVLSLEESDLCPPATEPRPRGDHNRPNIVPEHTTPIPTTTTPIVTTTIPATTPIVTTTTIATTTPTPPTPVLTPTTTTIPTTTPIVTTTTTPIVTTTIPTTIPTTTPTPTTTAPTPMATFSHSPFGATLVQSTFPAVRPITAPTTRSVPSTITSATPTLQVFTTAEATATSTPPWVVREVTDGRTDASAGAAVFCFWLFVGCLLLCVASAACILVTAARLVVWYRQVYKPLSVMLARRGGGGDGLRLLTCSKREEKEAAGGGVMALYRSVLYVHKDEGETSARQDGGKEGEGGNERLLVALEPTGRGGALREEEEDIGREEKRVYRKILYRLSSRQEEVEGWRSVMEECQVSAGGGGGRRQGEERGGGGGRRQGEERGGGAVPRKSYSVILREEREEAGGGREELDWVVGGWEVKQEGAESRSSWGEWLAHFLPSMPWGVVTPPDGEAAQ